MRFAKSFATIGLLGLLVGSAPAADLSKIPRTIAKEPVYKSKPKYCLVVFGPEAKKRMWIVLDGDVLYVDKNGNGDLTEKGKSLSFTNQPLNVSDPTYPLEELHKFSVGDLTDGGVTYANVEIGHSILKKNFEAKSEFGKDMARLLKKDPELTRLGVHGSRNGKVRFQGLGYAADSPKEAPILHIDGPLTMKPYNVSGLVRGSKPFDFYAVVGTQGLGEDTFAILDYDEIPESAKPLVEIEFPGKGESNGADTMVSLGRCWGCLFHGPVWVPEKVGNGKAKVTLSFPDWKEGKVIPASFEVPVLEPEPNAQVKQEQPLKATTSTK